MRTATPLARFGGFAGMPSIGITRGNYTRIALPPSFPKPYSAAAEWRQPKTAPVRSGWLPKEKVCFIGKRECGTRLETASQFAKLSPRAAFTDWMGRAWFGYDGGTIIILQDENILRVFPADDSPVGSVRAINGRGRAYLDWWRIGISFLRRKPLPTDHPCGCRKHSDPFWGVEETFDGSLWLAESRGVIQVPASEVRQALDNPSYRVKYRIFDSSDGLPGTFAGVANDQKRFREPTANSGSLRQEASSGSILPTFQPMRFLHLYRSGL